MTALVAGLGVGGIAVALAVQNILGDLFASLSIALDKPFAVGDFLIIDEHLGSVEDIGLRTPREKLELIPKIIREAIESQQQVRFDRSHFQAYGDFAFVFETVYYVLGPDYNLYMDVQQAINLLIHARFEEHSIEFAYQTQTVHVVKAGAE